MDRFYPEGNVVRHCPSEEKGTNSIPLLDAPTPKEKRRHSRLNCQFHVKIRNNVCRFAVVTNLSLGGFKLKIPRLLGKNALIELQLDPHHDNAPVLPCRIEWCKKEENGTLSAGGFFTQLTHLQQTLLHYVLIGFQRHNTQQLADLKPFFLLSDPTVSTHIVDETKNVELSPFLNEIATLVKGVLDRPFYLWQWCHEGIRRTTLPCVCPNSRNLLYNTKLLSIIFLTLLDDLADKYKNDHLLSLAIRIPCGKPIRTPHLEEDEKKYLHVCSQVWNIILSNLRQLPRYYEFEKILFFDYEQLFTTMHHALLCNSHPFILNLSESIIYQGYNMHIVINLMMDIMCSPTLNKESIGLLRSIALKAQVMCRIANWLATWNREIKDSDYTSGIIANAMEQNYLNLAELHSLSAEEMTRKIQASTVEANLLHEWTSAYHSITEEVRHLQEVDLAPYILSMEYFFQSQLASKGLQ